MVNGIFTQIPIDKVRAVRSLLMFLRRLRATGELHTTLYRKFTANAWIEADYQFDNCLKVNLDEYTMVKVEYNPDKSSMDQEEVLESIFGRKTVIRY